MDAKAHAHRDQLGQTSPSLNDDRVRLVVEPDGTTGEFRVSQEEFDRWLDGFRSRYAQTLEYLQSH
jgi:hypothetical protein